MTRNRRLLGLVFVVTLFVLGGAVSAQTPTAGGTLNVGLVGDITAVDPAFSYDFTTGAVVPQVTEGLLAFDQEQKLIPALAESWDNPDPLTYVYHIRQGVKFSDGTPMTIDDVVFSMERVKNPDTASTLGWIYANVATIEKTDDRTVTVKLAKPDVIWRYGAATTATHVISKAFYDANQDKFGKTDAPALGTGPYRVTDWQSGTQITVEPNPNYWDTANPPKLDQIVFKIVPDATARTVALKTGDIDLAMGPDAIAIDQFSIVGAMDNINFVKNVGFQVDYVVFNCQREPFTDPNVRRAIYHALNVKEIVTNIIKDGGVPGKPTMVTPAMWLFEKDKFQAAFDALPSYDFNLDKAKELLAQTKVKDGFSATLITDNQPVRMSVALALQAAVKPLNIDLKVEQVTYAELINRIQQTMDFDMSTDVWAADIPDPAGNLYPTHIKTNIGSGGANQSAYINDEVDALLNEQNTTLDDVKRAELMIQAQAIIADEAPEIVIDYPVLVQAMSKKFTGYTVVPMWFWQPWSKWVYQVP